MDLYAILNETRERLVMVHFPALRLLYGSDAFQTGSDGKFVFPQGVSELVAADDREGPAVDRFFMMHVDPDPGRDLRRVLTKPSAAGSAVGSPIRSGAASAGARTVADGGVDMAVVAQVSRSPGALR